MKRLFTRIGLIFLGLLFLFPIFGVQCNDDEPEEPDKCGKYVSITKEWPNDFLEPASQYLYMEDGYYVYEYSPGSIDDVCPHKHITGSIEFCLDPSHGTNVMYSAEVVYGILFTYPILEWDQDDYTEPYSLYTGNFEFGMKSVYGDSPGWFLPIVRIYILNQGSDQATHFMMINVINHIKLRYNYYEYKEN